MNSLWNQLASRAGLTLDERQTGLLNRYLDLLLEANQVMNLTRIENLADAQIQHVADALTLLPFLPAGEHTLADVGSGGGVPGLVLAIAHPDVHVTLIESTQKKAAFLQRTAEAMDLKNVAVIADRAEKLIGKQSFDVVTARALAAMEKLAEWCLPLVKKGGTLLAMKGPKIAEELPSALKTIQRLHGNEPVVHAVEANELQGHVIVVIGRR